MRRVVDMKRWLGTRRSHRTIKKTTATHAATSVAAQDAIIADTNPHGPTPGRRIEVMMLHADGRRLWDPQRFGRVQF